MIEAVLLVATTALVIVVGADLLVRWARREANK